MEVGALKTRISLDSAQFEKGMAGINRQLKALQNEQKAVTSSGTGFARGINELRAKSDVLNRTLRVQQAQVQELAKRYQASKQATGENSKQTQNAQIAYQRAVAEMNKTQSALKGVTAEIERQTNPWNVLSNNMNDIGNKLQNAGRRMTDFGKSMSLRVTAPVLGLGGAALKVGMDFEESMSKVQALTQGSAKEMKAMEEQAKELGATTIFSASQAADGMAFLGMAGWKTNEIIAGMPGLLSLAAASQMDLGRAADITSNIMSAFGIEANNAGHVADVLAAAASNANTNVEQMGLAMTYVAPVANTLGWNIEETAAAIMVMSDAGIQGEKAGAAFATSLQRLSKPTAEAKKVMDKLNISFFDSEGKIKPLPKLVSELEKATNGMSNENKAAALSTLFGAEAYKNWAVVLEAGGKTLGENTKMLKTADGAADKMAKAMTNNAKGSITEFKSALEGVGIALSEHMIPAATDMVKKGTELVRKFGELDEGTQKNIIKMGLFAAAIGPAALVAGNLTTAIGGVIKVGGSLVGLLGKNGGTGLLGKIGMLGPLATSPVGLAITGAGALALGIYAVSNASKESTQKIAESIESRKKEIDSTEKLISQYEKLQRKNRLSTDEILRYMDIMDDLKNAKGEDAIKALTDEQAKLLKKSGLTNKEMEEFLGLNDKIVEKSPNSVKAISEQGNAYAGVLDELKKLNAEQRKELVNDTFMSITKERQKQEKSIAKQRELLKEIDTLENKSKENIQTKIKYGNEVEAKTLEIARLENEISNSTGETKIKLLEKKAVLQDELSVAEGLVAKYKEEEESNQKKIKDKKASLAETEKELAAYDELLASYGQQVLYEQGIVSEKGKANEALKQQQKEVDTARAKVQELFKNQKISSSEYKEQNKKLDEQQRKIDVAKQKLSQMNEVAGKTVYKDVNVSTKPSIQTINKELASGVRKQVSVFTALDGKYRSLTDPTAKTVNIRTVGGYHAEPGYATGTDYHPGGPFIAGEEGFELGRMGNRWEWLELGRYNKPAGYEVFTHGESRKIIQALNNMPAYASGARPTNEVNRVVSQLNNQPVDNSQTVSLLTRIALAIESGQSIQIEGKEVMRATVKHFDKGLNDVGDRRKAAWGG
jgi:TP901 family phage tail tape measure protein